MFNRTAISIVILVGSILFLCPRTGLTEGGDGNNVPPCHLPAPVTDDYKINPLDLLEISVYQEKDLNRTIRVAGDGSISLPLVGKVHVGGCSVIGSEELIARLLSRNYLVNPQVTVFVKEYHKKNVFILGEVKLPGSYDLPYDRDLTVLEAITMAGGFTNLAAINKTRIIRMNNGKQEYIEVKISDITQKGDKSKDVTLNPGDVIFIPERIF